VQRVRRGGQFSDEFFVSFEFSLLLSFYQEKESNKNTSISSSTPRSKNNKVFETWITYSYGKMIL